MMQAIPSKVAADGEKPPKEKNPRKTPWRNEPPQFRTISTVLRRRPYADPRHQHTYGSDDLH